MGMRTIAIVALVFLFMFGVDGCALSHGFYEKSCPQVEHIVAAALRPVFLRDPTSPAAFLRLMFHDCQVQGCDASVLVDPGEETFEPTEMASSKNFGIRKREVISVIKSMVEAQCPLQVSCADILILAAREAVAVSGGPRIKVPLGRRDSADFPSYQLVDASLPSTTIGVDGMLTMFSEKGMTIEESVAILGAHSLGITHCSNLQDRLYSHEVGLPGGIDPGFAMFLMLRCPKGFLASNLTSVPNDPTMLTFDNQYHLNAIRGRGVLHIDAEMVLDLRTAETMQHFSVDQDAFFQAFSSAFVKLSCSGVLTGNQGVIRKTCNAVD